MSTARSCTIAIAVAGSVAALLVAAPARAKCIDDVHALAEAHGVTSKPPVVNPDSKQSPGVTTRELSGCPDAAKSSWFRYLDAQERLIAAFGDA